MKMPGKRNRLCCANFVRSVVSKMCPYWLKQLWHTLRSIGSCERNNSLLIRKLSTHLVKTSCVDEIVFCPNGDVFDVDYRGVQFLVPHELSPSFKIGISNWEPVESSIIIACLHAGGVLFDIGANIGLHSIRAARMLPSVSCHAFEPVADNFSVLMKNVTRNNLQSQISCFNLAVGESPGSTNIFGGFGTGNYIGYSAKAKSQSVRLVSLDSWSKETGVEFCDFLKCDTEGHELMVLRGAMDLLAANRPFLLIEITPEMSARYGYSPDDVFEYLISIDYVSINTVICPLSSNSSRVDMPIAENNYLFSPIEKSRYCYEAISSLIH